jgi:hypothetical protein
LKPFSSLFCLAHRLSDVLKHAFNQTSSKWRACPSLSTETSFALTEGKGDENENDSESYPMAAILEESADHALLVLQAIQDCKQLANYVKMVMHFFSLSYLLLSLLWAGLN